MQQSAVPATVVCGAVCCSTTHILRHAPKKKKKNFLFCAAKSVFATCVVQVQEWDAKDASAYPTAVVDSSTAKRRKVYFGCRDVYDDPQVSGPAARVAAVTGYCSYWLLQLLFTAITG